MQHKFLITLFFVISETEKVKNQNGFHHGGGDGDGVFMSSAISQELQLE